MPPDIFEDMRQKIGCLYISDLPYHKRTLWQELKRIPPSDYPRKQWEDFARYVFDVDYAVMLKLLSPSLEKPRPLRGIWNKYNVQFGQERMMIYE